MRVFWAYTVMSEDIQVEEIWYPLPFFLVSTRRQKIMKAVEIYL